VLGGGWNHFHTEGPSPEWVLESEQIRVSTSPGQDEHQKIILDMVNQKPIGLDMAFAVAGPIT